MNTLKVSNLSVHHLIILPTNSLVIVIIIEDALILLSYLLAVPDRSSERVKKNPVVIPPEKNCTPTL